MAKRYTDTCKWTGNKWFRKLPNKIKLLWLYILDTCDAVGVWEEDIELAEYVLKESLEKQEILMSLEGRITMMNDGEKWWIDDFCDFQYKKLSDDSTSKPIQSYVSLLKKHGLWNNYNNIDHTLSVPYPKGMDTLKDKEKDKEKEQDKETKPKAGSNIPPTIEQVKEYCAEKKNNIDAEVFWNFYESKGWLVGKAKMKNWYAAVANFGKGDKNGRGKRDFGNSKRSIQESEGTSKFDGVGTVGNWEED